MVEQGAKFYVTECDWCGRRTRNARVRPDLRCCLVPLCDVCAERHRAELAEEAFEIKYDGTWIGGGEHR